MSDHICPWWLAYTFDNPARRFFQNPYKILGGLVAEGQTAIDLGCGMGYFSIAMARLVGEKGQVISVDVQEQMLQRVQRRAQKAGVESRITLHRCRTDRIGLEEQADFVLAFWMVHEVPDQKEFFQEVGGLLKPTGRFLLVEPTLEVSAPAFQRTVETAQAAGLKPEKEPKVRLSLAALFAPEGKEDRP